MITRSRMVSVCMAAVAAVATVVHAESGDVTGTIQAGGHPERDVVIWIAGVPDVSPVPRKPVVLDQRNLTFLPHVLAIQVGTSVRMPNSDRVYHNVFSFRDGKRFDLGLYPVGTSKVVTFDRPGVSRLFCNIHPNMAGYIVAVDSAHFAVTDDAGKFTIRSVPAGSYTYHAWRPGHEPTDGQMVVTAGRPVEIVLP
jgi:plastocyanin